MKYLFKMFIFTLFSLLIFNRDGENLIHSVQNLNFLIKHTPSFNSHNFNQLKPNSIDSWINLNTIKDQKDISKNKDDSNIIQSAIDTGKNVFIPADSYKVDKEIRINNSNQIIYSEGGKIVSSFNKNNVFKFENISNNLIFGLKFVSNYSSRHSAAINIVSSNNIVILGNSFSNYLGGGVIIRGTSSRNIISKNFFSNVSYAPSSTYGADYGSIALGEFTSHNTVSNNDISKARHSGISLVSSNNNQLLNNIIHNDKTSKRSMGIYTIDSSDNSIDSNYINNSYAEGIVIQSTTNSHSSRNKIYKNIIQGAKYTGISVVGKEKILVENLSIKENIIKSINYSTDHGIFLKNVGFVNINNNEIYGVQNGVRSTGTKNNNIFLIGNSLSDILDDGITVTGTKSLLLNNTLNNIKGNGIRLINTTNNVIANNTIKNIENYGILSEHSSKDFIITNNSYDQGTKVLIKNK